jgi:hypothetical protein
LGTSQDGESFRIVLDAQDLLSPFAVFRDNCRSCINTDNLPNQLRALHHEFRAKKSIVFSDMKKRFKLATNYSCADNGITNNVKEGMTVDPAICQSNTKSLEGRDDPSFLPSV